MVSDAFFYLYVQLSHWCFIYTQLYFGIQILSTAGKRGLHSKMLGWDVSFLGTQGTEWGFEQSIVIVITIRGST